MRRLAFLVVPLLVSCNIYSPFAPSSSTEDLVEEGRKCIQDGDYACAFEAYNAIPDPITKQQQLCLGYLTQGGLTLSILLNTLTSGTSKVLGDVATGLMPWTDGKSTAFNNAKTACTEFATLATSATGIKESALLKTLALIAHCSIRMAKTDQFVATSNSDTACTTAGNNSGTLTQADIADNSDGSITAVGMCAADVTACNEDIAGISGDGLSNAGLSDIKAGVDAIPTELKTSGAATNSVRSAIRDSVQ